MKESGQNFTRDVDFKKAILWLNQFFKMMIVFPKSGFFYVRPEARDLCITV